MNKIILLISTTGSYIGGAEKRYLYLFNYISKQRKDYYLVINRKLYANIKKNNVLDSYENVRILTLFGESIQEVENSSNISEQEKLIRTGRKNISKLRSYIGRRKMFIKSIVIWLSFVFEFRKILKELRSKIVYTAWTGGMLAWPLKYFFKFKLVYSYSDSTVEITSRKLYEIFGYSDHWILKHADKIDFLSPAIVDLFKRNIGYIKDSRFTISPNSFIDYKLYFSDRQKENNVVFLSRLYSNKNPILFLQSAKVFSEKYPDYHKIKFYIIGEGELEETSKEFIHDNNLINTYFIGKTLVPWNYLRKSRVFVSIQQINNYPSQALLEAMACENAIIASDVGETRLLVTENVGILVKLDPVSIADAINKLFITNGLIEKLGGNARRKVLQEQSVEKYAEYFYSITDYK
jgi:glycosyltransferase involved in cell wall biosynthesis